ncbi:hypothetical protein ACS0TY_024783 [Phlomoides rotata]
MKVMSYNVRGLGQRMKRMDVKQKIIQNRIEFCCIQESKIEEMEEKIGNDLWYNKEYDWVWREAEGRSGGIISIWNRKVFTKSSAWHMRGMLVVNGIWLEDGEQVMIINVYAPCAPAEKEKLWDAITIVLQQNEDVRTCVVGDFNAIREEHERVGRRGEIDRREIRNFTEFISSNNLIELHLKGRKFTCGSDMGCDSRDDMER